MKIITKKKQRECILRLIAIRRITDDMNNSAFFENEQIDAKRWADNMEYLANNILEISNIIGGEYGMIAILKDLQKGCEQLKENEHDGE